MDSKSGHEEIGRAVDHLQYSRLRAPRNDGDKLDVPQRKSISAVFSHNLAERKQWPASSILDIAHWSSVARAELLSLADAYSRIYLPNSSPTDTERPAPNRPIICAGHQPTLFHPGVWYKNFRLHQLAKQLDATAVNLVVDNDLSGGASIKLPLLGSPEENGGSVRTGFVPFDDPGPAVAWEMRGVANEPLFRSFGQRLAQQIQPLVQRPLINQLWPEVLAALDKLGPDSVGRVLAAGRHRLEWANGIRNLEVPISHLASISSLAALMACVIENSAPFMRIYNGVLHRYRANHGIRSSAHPVPALTTVDRWHETPFWVWTRDNHHRRPLMVHLKNNTVELSDTVSTLATVPSAHLQQWLQDQGRTAITGAGELFIRPRALMTTMFTRLLASDLFIHGIGGAKYDQLTDQIISEFFGVRGPEYLTSTATFTLPALGWEKIAPQDITSQQQRIRQMRFHPESFIETATGKAAELISAKRRAIAGPSSLSGVERHRAIEASNLALVSVIADQQHAATTRLAELKSNLRASQIMHSREYSFCLHDRTLLDRLKES